MSAAIFDILLAITLVWSGLRAMTTVDLVGAVVFFIVFWLLMALAWVRLDATDIALAEAAIGTGLVGALLLDAIGSIASTHKGKKEDACES